MAGATKTADQDGSHGEGSWLAHHFETPNQQFESAKLGMWLFLGQEVLFFSGLFVAYGVFLVNYPDAFAAGADQLNRIIGGFNTCVLLVSSFTAAMAVRSAQLGERGKTTTNLGITIVCAFAFLVVKYFEYKAKIDHGLLPGESFAPDLEHINWAFTGLSQAQIEAGLEQGGLLLPPKTHVFFGIYFVLTGLHGLHVAIGIGVLAWVLIRNLRGDFTRDYWTPVDIAALYWHLVDLVWIYLFPLLYLI